VKKICKILLEVELSDAPCAMFDFLKGIKEDLQAMQQAGVLVDYGITIQEENPKIIRLDEETFSPLEDYRQFLKVHFTDKQGFLVFKTLDGKTYRTRKLDGEIEIVKLDEGASGGSATGESHKAEAHRGDGESFDAEQWWAALGSREPDQNQTKEASE